MTGARRDRHSAKLAGRRIAQSARLPQGATLTVVATGFLAVNLAVGLYAYDKQRELGQSAVALHDRAFISMTYVEDARVAFLRAVDTRVAMAPAGGTSLPRSLSEVANNLDMVIERAGSDDARARAVDLRAAVERLGKLPDDLGRQALVAQIQADFAALARRTAHDGLDARNQAEASAAEGGLVLLASVAISGCLVVLVSVLLGRALLQQRLSVARIAHMVRVDGLTELLNRPSFDEALQMASARASRGEEFAVLCLDLSRFKQVCDTLGHRVGDALLCAVAGRLRGLVRETDSVARLGGDEFAVLQMPVAGPDNAALLAQRIIATLQEPYGILGHRVVIGATVGIALGHAGSRDVDTIMRNADLALYRAKQEGRGIYRFFEAEMDARAQARRQLELDLRGAIEREEFELYYQPLVSVEQREITQFEALIRWRHPQRGLVPPSDFIPLAEEIGLIVPIGAWALRTACREATGWPERVSVAVNLSATQFVRANVVEQVTQALLESGLAAHRLEVEITEATLLTDSQRTLETLHALRKLGVRIAMDDFGTGYSSLSYLRSFPFDKLKIDQSFIRDLGEAGDSAAIVRAIAGMGQSLGIRTTAEGVETEEQMRQLVSDGCDELQGYFFSRPCPASEVGRLLTNGIAHQVA